MRTTVFVLFSLVVFVLSQSSTNPCEKPCYSANTNPCPEGPFTCLKTTVSPVANGCEYVCINKTADPITYSDQMRECKIPCRNLEFRCTNDEYCEYLGAANCYNCKPRCNTQVACLASPCAVDQAGKECAGRLVMGTTNTISCVDNYCDGCRALWYVNGVRVCTNVSTCTACPTECPAGTKPKLDPTNGCRICGPCETVCPQVACLVNCPFGYVYENGCQTCRCKECPPIDCALACPNGYITDAVTGCKKCECAPSPCSLAPCPAIACEYGFEVDPNGCQTCKCRNCTKPVCPTTVNCIAGFKRDSTGCPTCDCLPPCLNICPFGYDFYSNTPTATNECKCRCPVLSCFADCPNGFVIDRYGCKTCECVPKLDPCPRVACDIYCQYGYEYSNSCPICKCRLPPICPVYDCVTLINCIYGKLKDANGCPTCQCEPCPKVLCARFCEFGYNLDPTTGCETCDCKPGPICTVGTSNVAPVCPLDCVKGELKENGCPTCKCNPVVPCDCTTKPTIPPKMCPDGVHKEELTSVCARDTILNKCEWILSRCPICIAVTIPAGSTLSDADMLKIRLALAVNSADVTVEVKPNTDGSKTYIICFKRDGLATTVVATDLNNNLLNSVKEDHPNAVSYVYSNGAAVTPSSNSHVLVPALIALFIMVFLL